MMNETRAATVWDVDPISSIIQRIHFKHATKGLRSISVVSEKRSEGKTTVSMLLARGLKEVYDFKILLIDLNPDGDPLLNQYLKSYETQRSKDGMVQGHPFDFSIFRLKNIDMDWLKNAYDGLYTNQLINSFSTQYDLVIVDTMSSSGPDKNSFRVNTHSNIVVSTKRSFGRRVNKLQTELEQDRKNVLGVIFNR